jgi:HPt (histidine-containing phosphotransfer) domain-containing protein
MRNLPIIAMTANVTKEDRTRCLEAGMNDFQPKPIRPELFLQTVAQWMRQRQTAAEEPQLDAALPEAMSVPGVISPAADSDVTSPSVLDIAALRTLAGGDEYTAQRLARRYVHTAQKAYTDMKAAGVIGDLVALGRIGHRLKSASAQVGAAELAETCIALEQLGQKAGAMGHATVIEHAQAAGLVERLGPLIARLESEFGDP